jgi:hypothetical protein
MWLTLNEDYLSLKLHICDYVAVGSLYRITLHMLNLAEMSGLNSLTGNCFGGKKIVLFGRYVCDLYIEIVQ